MIFAFAFNEYHWKRIPFSKHRTIESASRSIRKLYAYKGSATSDYEYYELSRAGLEKWASECNYDIDWENCVLITREGQ